MSKPRKKQGNPDFRHRVTCPAPTNQQIESRLIELLSPGTFANLKDVKDKERKKAIAGTNPTSDGSDSAEFSVSANTAFDRCATLPRSRRIVVDRGNVCESASSISTPWELARAPIY